ncbi:MAG: hypothetical protein U0840_06070 [Gemmataceae bacterium]
MLTPQELELLTAHVDGELNANQRRQLFVLLERNGEARELLVRLESDASQLRRLSAPAIPVDLSSRIVSEINRTGLRPQRRVVPATPPRRYSVWVSLATAALVLLAVGLGAFFLHTNREGPGDLGGSVAVNKPEDLGTNPPSVSSAVVRNTTPGKETDVPVAGVNPPASEQNLSGSGSQKVPPRNDTPRKPEEGILAANGSDGVNKFEKVELDLPTIGRLTDLSQPASRKTLEVRLAGLKTTRIELTTRDSRKALDRVQALLANHQVKLLVDPATVTRLRKTTLRTDVAVYLENVTPADLTALLQELAPTDSLEGAFVVKDLSRWDRGELQALLGLDPLVSRPGTPRKSGLDIRKPLHEQTQIEVVAALEGQGVPRPGAETGHTAYAAQLPSNRSRPAELKTFLESRKPLEAGKLQILLVLRQVGN